MYYLTQYIQIIYYSTITIDDTITSINITNKNIIKMQINYVDVLLGVSIVILREELSTEIISHT